MSDRLPQGKDYVDTLITRVTGQFNLRPPPTHTIPPWASYPRRQQGTALRAALRVQRQTRGPAQYGCHKIPGADSWHANISTAHCREGIYFLSPWRVTIPLIVFDIKGSGCNRARNLEATCTTKYILPIDLRPGINLITWCEETGITTCPTGMVAGPEGIEPKFTGPTIYLPQSETLQYDRHDYNRYSGHFNMINNHLIKRIMPDHHPQPEVRSIYIHEDDPRHLPNPSSIIVLTVKDPSGGLKEPFWMRGALRDGLTGLRALQWHYLFVDHPIMNKHVWPAKCHCLETKSKGQWVDESYQDFRPSRMLLDYLRAPPHQVIDEEGRFLFTLQGASIRIEQKRPIIRPMEVIKLENNDDPPLDLDNQIELDNGDEDVGGSSEESDEEGGEDAEGGGEGEQQREGDGEEDGDRVEAAEEAEEDMP